MPSPEGSLYMPTGLKALYSPLCLALGYRLCRSSTVRCQLALPIVPPAPKGAVCATRIALSPEGGPLGIYSPYGAGSAKPTSMRSPLWGAHKGRKRFIALWLSLATSPFVSLRPPKGERDEKETTKKPFVVNWLCQ